MTEALTFAIPDAVAYAIKDLISTAVREALARDEQHPEGFLDVDGAAKFLASTPTAIRSLVKRDAIRYYKTPAGRLLFDRAELDAWVRTAAT